MVKKTASSEAVFFADREKIIFPTIVDKARGTPYIKSSNKIQRGLNYEEAI